MFNAAPLSFDFVVWMHCFHCVSFHGSGSNPPWVTAHRVNSLPAETVKLIGDQLQSAPAGAREVRATYDAVRSLLHRLHPEISEQSCEPWLAEPQADYVRNRAMFAKVGDLDGLMWELMLEAIVLRAGVPPWVGAERLSAIRRPVVDVLSHMFLDGCDERRGRAAFVAIAEEWMSRLQMDLVLPSEEEWASFRRCSTS